MKVLVVDDDEKILKVLTAYLEKEGYSVITARDGWEAVDKARQLGPDIVLLDVMLPSLDGWGVCKEIRRTSDVPIIMLTARDDEADRIIGLELGADDYVIKPFSPKEVLARMRAIFRRLQPASRRDGGERILKVGDAVLDQNSRSLTIAGTPVELTPTEYKLLELFLAHPGQVFSRLQLIEKVQDYAFEGYERTVDSHIKNLRKKLGASPDEPHYIKTIYGVGYKLVGEQHA
ncbi:two component transcriptional regulator, winged helix family [Thermosinus carboxydivorans Nor1]|uniref:Two component transcriptional regulator, winged helix family n=1 Tax=Thermosinus carboxydivorans Nor1 TaxID=401526 RepID=A1HRL8_9FIRM|nr:response regulator transcription factor [Thermosinus carboxydivorans]EAX47345.1 two component transcriptional regulator, winged helix family [Thermosinus carboxydivorans Nor1]